MYRTAGIGEGMLLSRAASVSCHHSNKQLNKYHSLAITYPISLFYIPSSFGSEGLDSHAYPDTIADFGNSKLFQNRLVAFKKGLARDVVLWEYGLAYASSPQICLSSDLLANTEQYLSQPTLLSQSPTLRSSHDLDQCQNLLLAHRNAGYDIPNILNPRMLRKI